MMAMAPMLLVVPPSATVHSLNVQNARYGAAFSAAAFVQTNARRILLPPRAGHGFYVEPDIDEDEDLESDKTPGEGEEDDFPWGIADGAHSWFAKDHEGEDIWKRLAEQIEEAGGPTKGLQKWISWTFLPLLFTAMAFKVPSIYLVGYTVLFIFAFIGIEMAKPDMPHHFPPELYLEKLEEWKQKEAAQAAALATTSVEDKVTSLNS